MFSLFRILIAFLALTGAAVIATSVFNMEFGNANFWDHHGWFFLFFMAAFPRLTLLFSGVATGGVLWWLSFIFAPRILVAFLATVAYWNQNEVLVVLAWLVALSGESSEKYVVVNRSREWTRR